MRTVWSQTMTGFGHSWMNSVSCFLFFHNMVMSKFCITQLGRPESTGHLHLLGRHLPRKMRKSEMYFKKNIYPCVLSTCTSCSLPSTKAVLYVDELKIITWFVHSELIAYGILCPWHVFWILTIETKCSCNRNIMLYDWSWNCIQKKKRPYLKP